MLGGNIGKEFAVVFSGEVAVEEPGNGVVEFRFAFGLCHEGSPYEDFSPGVEFAFVLFFSVFGKGDLLVNLLLLLEKFLQSRAR